MASRFAGESGLSLLLDLPSDRWTTLFLLVGEGVVTYVVAILVLDRRHVSELLVLLRT